MDSINVLYTVDKNYFNYMLVSIYSFLEHNQDLKVVFHIIGDQLNKEDKDLAKSIVHNVHTNAGIEFYDFEPIREKIMQYGIPKWNNSDVANARLFFDSCISGVDKLLYLDSDTIVVDSLNGLSEYNGTLHMSKDAMPMSYYKSIDPSLQCYYNSGVIWLDVDKWKEENCHERLVEGMRHQVDYKYPDQDLINITLKDSIEYLPPSYNLFTLDSFYPMPVLFAFYQCGHILRGSMKEMKEAKEHPIILHSTPFYRWRGWTSKSLHPHKDYYANYFAKIGIPLIDNSHERLPNELIFKLLMYAKAMVPPDLKERIKNKLQRQY